MLLIKQAWSLGKDFFIDKAQRKKAYFLLISSIIIQLGMVYSAVLLNRWSSDFYNALQNLDKIAVYEALKTFFVLLVFTVFVFVAKYVSQANLALNWRRFMTEKYCRKWLHNYAYFGSNLLSHKNDNPDQRISEDLNSFVNTTIELSFGILSSIVTLAIFFTILWSLSGVLKFTALGEEFAIEGYLVYAALIYSIVGTVITYVIGKRLSAVDYLQEKKEANFRFAMMRLRENAQSISLYRGEKYENNIFKSALEEVIENTFKIISINRNLGIWSNLFNNISSISPILIAAPRYFAKEIQLGGLMQIRSAFIEVQESFSFLAISFKIIASYRAVVSRLLEFNKNIDHWNEVSKTKKIVISQQHLSDLIIKDLNIYTPDGKLLLEKLNLTFSPKNQYLLTGKNGAGKSTLIRAMGGIWIYGDGEILFPQNKTLFFIPQSPYMNIGSLFQVITYPACDEGDIDYIKELMNKMNIGYLIERLELTENWSVSLSLGEQQKIAILRAIIHKPDILIMDESTSSLTEGDENLAYNFIKEKLPNAIIISVGHRLGLKDLHNHEIKLS